MIPAAPRHGVRERGSAPHVRPRDGLLPFPRQQLLEFLVLLDAHAPAAESLVRPLVATPVRAVLLAVLLAVASVPHLIRIYRSNEPLNALFVEPGECPGPDLPKGSAQSWRCLRAQACSHPSPLLHAYRMAPGTDMPKRALFYPALLALGCLGLRRARLSRTCSPWAPRRCRCP